MPKKFRTKAQNSRMHGLAAKLGITHEDLQNYAFEYSGERTDHTSELYFSEAANLINYLDRLANPKPQVSLRTIQYRRQKAGTARLATSAPNQLKLMHDLAEKREITPQGLADLCSQTLGGATYPRTTKETSKIIEALKSMNTRDRVFGAFNKNQEAA